MITTTDPRCVRGPLLHRWLLPDGVLDLPQRADAPRPDLGVTPPAGVGAVGASAPEADPDTGGWRHPLPWPAVGLADLLADRASSGDHPGPQTSLPPTTLWSDLGALLRARHASGPIGGRDPEPLRRVADADLPAPLDALADAARDALRTGPRVGLHGQPALAHLFVPASARPEQAVLTWWSAAATGPAEFDLGHLVGDLLECAVLTGPTDPDAAASLRAAVPAVLAGHGAASHRGRLVAAARIRVLDHYLRLTTLFGPDAAPTIVAGRLALVLPDLLDPLLDGPRP